MHVRIAELTDLAAIVEIYNQAISAGQRTADIQPFVVEERLDWFNAHTADKYPLLVAVNYEKVVGYLTISPYREGRQAFIRTAEVSYYIHFEHHREGVASQLINYVITLCPSLDIKTLIAMLLASNVSSIGFLEKHGFNEWGRLPKVAEFPQFISEQQKVDHLFYGRHISKMGQK